MVLRVRVDDVAYLADVGFGDCFRRPLALATPEPQSDGIRDYRIDLGDATGDLFERHGDAWKPQYRFQIDEHALCDFASGCDYHQSSPLSHFTRRRVCSRATSTGRITLRDDRLITTGHDGTRREDPVDGAEAWAAVLRDRFGIVL